MPDTTSLHDPYSDWQRGGGTGYDKILTSPRGWWWRFDGNPETFSRPTLKTITAGAVALILMAGCYSQIGKKNQDTVIDFRSTLTNPEDNTNPVEELRERIMQVARSRAEKGQNSPRIVTVEIDTATEKVRVLGEEIPLEAK